MLISDCSETSSEPNFSWRVQKYQFANLFLDTHHWNYACIYVFLCMCVCIHMYVCMYVIILQLLIFSSTGVSWMKLLCPLEQ